MRYKTLGTKCKATEVSEIKKKELEEVFRTAVVRIPADSISGTQILKFSGFTGRNDYGVLTHGLAMRAKGGADTDIDSAYLYFGGKGGFKKSWKDIVEANVDEYYEKQPDGRFKISEAKSEEFEKKLIAPRNESEAALRNSKAGLFAPNTLMEAAEGAAVGRGSLPTSVNAKNILGSAYDAIIRKGFDTFKIEDKYGKEHEITLIPKTSETEKAYINKLMRSQVAFSSDAMDYGMPTTDWYQQALNAHFTIKSKTPKIIQKFGVNIFKKNGIIGALSKANSAYYGKDYTRDRQWTIEDRKNLTKDLMKESDEYLRTITPRIA